MSQQAAPLHIHKGHERRLLLGHPWVFSNEIASDLSDLRTRFTRRCLHPWGHVGRARLHQSALPHYGAHLVTAPRESSTADFFHSRLAAALRRRAASFSGGAELSAGVQRRGYASRPDRRSLSGSSGVADTHPGHGIAHRGHLRSPGRLMQPQAIIARNDVGIRTLEGLPHEKKVLRGSTADASRGVGGRHPFSRRPLGRAKDRILSGSTGEPLHYCSHCWRVSACLTPSAIPVRGPCMRRAPARERWSPSMSRPRRSAGDRPGQRQWSRSGLPVQAADVFDF